jgi:isochorismate synthase
MGPVREALACCLERGLTFAAYHLEGRVRLLVSREPGLVHIPWQQLDDVEHAFLVAPFQLPSTGCPALLPHLQLDLTEGPFDPGTLTGLAGFHVKQAPTMHHWDRQGHADAIRWAQARMRAGELEKVVLARTLEQTFHRTAVADLFLSAVQDRPEAFVCLVNCPEYGSWMGASPEMLVQCTNGRVRVDSLAGTLPRATAPGDAGLWGDKERDEQAVVTRSVLDLFALNGLVDVQLDGPHVMEAGPVAHLHSTITASLGTASLAALVHALHPTPAVCGTPRGTALAAITTLEPQDRGLYAGFWGPWRGAVDSRLHVNIRCLRLLDDTAVLHVGGGITAGSDPEKEWQETEHKALVWQRLLSALRTGIS